jgi:multidrug resistance protein
MHTDTKEKDLASKSDEIDSEKDGNIQEHNTHLKEDEISIAPSRTSTSSDHSSSSASPTPTNPKFRPITLSRTTSVTPDAILIPRTQRRGLLARFTLIPEVENPYHYTRKTKWFLTFIVAFCAMAAPMGSAIVMPVLHEISIAFNATHTVTNMSVAVYMLSMSIFPLWWSSFSERLGRRTIYITSFILFVVFAILSAVSNSIAMLIVMRTLSGGAAASVQAVGAGSIADIWEVKERGRAMGIFYLGPLCGPLFAPIIGGALGAGLGWRSTQWFLVVYGGATLIFIIFALPETLPRKEVASIPVPSSDAEKSPRPELTRSTTRASTVQKTKSFLAHMRQIFVDPLRILLWLRFPPVLLTVYYASITFGSLYILNISIQSTFSSSPYSYSTLIIGLLYIPNSAGYLLASLFGGRWIDSIMHREARKAGRYDDKGKLIFRPEDRMRENAWIAAILYPLSLIVYGWTTQYHTSIAIPMVANFFFGIGSMLIFALVNTMLTEFMPKRAASGIALNNFVRNIFSFTGAVVADPLLKAIGNGWLMTILGIWSLVTGCMALGAMRYWGGRWRVKMVEELG